MSLRLPVADVTDEDGPSQSSSDEDDDDQTWDDWVSDSARQPCRSLFEEKSFPSVEEALKYDNATHSFDLNGTCAKLCMLFRFISVSETRILMFGSTGHAWSYQAHQLHSKTGRLLRSLNLLSDSPDTQKISAAEVAALTGTESFFDSDQYLIPVLEDDPLLRACCGPFICFPHNNNSILRTSGR